VLKAMAKDPGDRYQSAGEMGNDIQRALQGMPVAAATRAVGYEGTRRMGPATRMAGATSAIPPYDYGPEDGPPEREGRKKWPWVVAALVAVAIIAGLVYAVSYVSGGGSSYSVPNVLNLPLATAQQDIANAHLVSQVTRQASSTVPKNDVISTSPPFGTTVAKGSTVKLVVSTGAGTIKVPNVVGESQTAATSQLQGLGFVVNEVSAQNSTAPSGQVVGQNPAQGTALAKGSTVTIRVSGGGVQVPSVIGDPAGTAQQILSGDGFNVVTRTVAGPSGSTPGNVFSQTPSGGTLPHGGTVTIYVASQPTPSPTPSTPSPTQSSPSPTPSASSTGP
jgi:serine/threonine-protein kinase